MHAYEFTFPLPGDNPFLTVQDLTKAAFCRLSLADAIQRVDESGALSQYSRALVSDVAHILFVLVDAVDPCDTELVQQSYAEDSAESAALLARLVEHAANINARTDGVLVKPEEVIPHLTTTRSEMEERIRADLGPVGPTRVEPKSSEEVGDATPDPPRSISLSILPSSVPGILDPIEIRAMVQSRIDLAHGLCILQRENVAASHWDRIMDALIDADKLAALAPDNESCEVADPTAPQFAEAAELLRLIAEENDDAQKGPTFDASTIADLSQGMVCAIRYGAVGVSTNG